MRIFLTLALLGGLALAPCSKPESVPEPVRAVRTLTVGSDSAGGSYEFAAEVKARTESRLGFRVGGKIVRRNADLGDSVKRGQVLAQIDAQDFKLGQDAAPRALAWRLRRPTMTNRRLTTDASRNCATRASSARPTWSGATPR